MQSKPNWRELAATSHYQTAVAAQDFLQQQNWTEANQGLEALIEAMGRSDRRALTSQLTRLMSHIIQWKCQPERRSRSWEVTILDAREEIEEIQLETPSLGRSLVESIWQKCLSKAIREAEAEMNQPCGLASLSWEEVFETEYFLDSNA